MRKFVGYLGGDDRRNRRPDADSGHHNSAVRLGERGECEPVEILDLLHVVGCYYGLALILFSPLVGCRRQALIASTRMDKWSEVR